jgi:hypothetical protein
LISSGSVSVTIGRDTGRGYTAAELHAGDSFGEGALQEQVNNRRQCTVTVVGDIPCQCLVITRAIAKLLTSMTQANLEDRLNFFLQDLPSNSFLGHVSRPRLQALCGHCTSVTVPRNRVLLHQGRSLALGQAYVYFIRRGHCKLMKAIPPLNHVASSRTAAAVAAAATAALSSVPPTPTASSLNIVSPTSGNALSVTLSGPGGAATTPVHSDSMATPTPTSMLGTSTALLQLAPARTLFPPSPISTARSTISTGSITNTNEAVLSDRSTTSTTSISPVLSPAAQNRTLRSTATTLTGPSGGGGSSGNNLGIPAGVQSPTSALRRLPRVGGTPKHVSLDPSAFPPDPPLLESEEEAAATMPNSEAPSPNVPLTVATGSDHSVSVNDNDVTPTPTSELKRTPLTLLSSSSSGSSSTSATTTTSTSSNGTSPDARRTRARSGSIGSISSRTSTSTSGHDGPLVVEIGELVCGQFFGHWDPSDLSSPFSVVSHTEVELFRVPLSSLLRYVGSGEALAELPSPAPDHDDIRHAFDPSPNPSSITRTTISSGHGNSDSSGETSPMPGASPTEPSIRSVVVEPPTPQVPLIVVLPASPPLLSSTLAARTATSSSIELSPLVHVDVKVTKESQILITIYPTISTPPLTPLASSIPSTPMSPSAITFRTTLSNAATSVASSTLSVSSALTAASLHSVLKHNTAANNNRLGTSSGRPDTGNGVRFDVTSPPLRAGESARPVTAAHIAKALETPNSPLSSLRTVSGRRHHTPDGHHTGDPRSPQVKGSLVPPSRGADDRRPNSIESMKFDGSGGSSGGSNDKVGIAAMLQYFHSFNVRDELIRSELGEQATWHAYRANIRQRSMVDHRLHMLTVRPPQNALRLPHPK